MKINSTTKFGSVFCELKGEFAQNDVWGQKFKEKKHNKYQIKINRQYWNFEEKAK